MKFSCTQENLSSALSLVTPIANQHVNLPILNNVLFKTTDGGVLFETTDLEIGASVIMRAKVERKGSFTVPARLLSSYVDLLTHERVDSEVVEDRLKIQSGSNHAEFKGEKAENFPLMPAVTTNGGIRVKRNDLQRAFAQTIFATAVDETRPEINGVFFRAEGSQAICASTDSHRLSEVKISCKRNGGDEASEAILPLRCVQEVLKILHGSSEDEMIITLNDHQALFEMGSIRLYSKLVDGKFIDYHSVIPKNFRTSVIMNRDELLKAVKLTSLFSRTGIQDVHLEVDKAKHGVRVRTENAQIGQNASVVDAAIDGEDHVIIFNYRYLMDGLSATKSAKIHFNLQEASNAALFSSPDDPGFRYVLMPIKQ